VAFLCNSSIYSFFLINIRVKLSTVTNATMCLNSIEESNVSDLRNCT
jgi:hypothetical protein